MGGGDMARLRQQQRDAVAASDAALAQGARDAIGLRPQFAIGEDARRVVRADFDDRRAARISQRPSVAAIDADIVFFGDRPGEGAAAALCIRRPFVAFAVASIRNWVETNKKTLRVKPINAKY